MAILLVDMDEVVADLLGYVIHLHEVETGERLDPKTLTDWNKNREVLGTYFKREGIYWKLDVTKDSQTVLRDLSVNHRIFFVTAAPTPSSAMEKKMWVDRHFPWIGQKNVITTFDKYLIRGDLLLDDSPEFNPNFLPIRVCMDAPHNKHLEKGRDLDYRVTNFMEFLKLIEQLEVKGLLPWCSVPQLKKHMERP
ncbi:putative 5'-3'-deoxyribosencleotidase [Brevibacillus phage SecTim467]|uniref:Putative 5'-3'-deoxyribosencleotidase n=2 Tax=Jenstvirus jenst TaxID=1982225 RepID=A0A0K2CPR5_9CAUD|nr:putative 5'-3'-deoxyribonucleotidase [Brevibacillus phage Jenst]ALA07250.1 putative 5'-3'-deoxyribonucleotidase [Brevibacillus phage Jenst]ALA07574.1 putative 5'-3'-deoxyribosencleotidase [Brevibacillus phage SecTim467]